MAARCTVKLLCPVRVIDRTVTECNTNPCYPPRRGTRRTASLMSWSQFECLLLWPTQKQWLRWCFAQGALMMLNHPISCGVGWFWQWVRPPAAGGHCVLGTDLCHRDGEEEQKREQNSPWLKARYCICAWKRVHMLVILLPKLLSNRKIEFRRRQRRDFLLRLFGKVLEQKQHCSQSRTLSTEARDHMTCDQASSCSFSPIWKENNIVR